MIPEAGLRQRFRQVSRHLAVGWVIVLWCMEARGTGVALLSCPYQAARTESGRPRPSIRLSALTAIWVSTCWAGPAWERSVSPITRLYRLIAASALAR